jgi:uncharacterized membrane protein
MPGKTDHPLERLVFFSDAVFAIAITLLVIEIHPPHLEQDGAEPTLQALARLIPNFIGFIVSFAVIGAFWAGHHRAFSLAGRVGRGAVFWNLCLLGTIAFMPFVTGFMSGNYSKSGPAAVYWLFLLLTAILNMRVNFLVTGPRMVAADAAPDAVRDVRRRSTSVLFAALVALAISLFAPMAAPFGMGTIPLWIALLRRIGPWRAAAAEAPARPEAA